MCKCPKETQMHRQHCITVKLLFACACFLMGCAEASEADGNSCPPAGASGKISYVQVGYQQCNSDMPCFEPYAGKTSCPGDAFRCGIDASLNYYCTDGCRPGSVLCNDLCIDPLANSDFCGADLSCRSYERCSTGEVCVEGKCVLSSFSNCSNGEKRCNVNNLELCLNGIWRPSETCLGSTPVCDQVALRCVSSSNTKQSCAIQNITIVDSDSRCIGSTLVSCQDGSVIETPCTTTSVANADPSCDQSEKKCAFTCRDGFHKASDKCVLNCVSSICGNGEIQICGSDGALQAAKACPQIAHAKQYGGCSEDGKRCLVTDCETGFTPSSDGSSCMMVENICTANDKKCEGNTLKECSNGIEWRTVENCSDYGKSCDAQKGECITIIETFEGNNVLSTNYASGSWTSTNTNVVWSWVDARKTDSDTGKIDEVGIVFKGANTAKLETTLNNGLGSLEFSVKKAFSGGGNRQVSVSVNGTEVSCNGLSAFDDDIVHHVVCNDINIKNTVSLKIQNKSTKQLIVDNVVWNEYK